MERDVRRVEPYFDEQQGERELADDARDRQLGAVPNDIPIEPERHNVDRPLNHERVPRRNAQRLPPLGVRQPSLIRLVGLGAKPSKRPATLECEA